MIDQISGSQMQALTLGISITGDFTKELVKAVLAHDRERHLSDIVVLLGAIQKVQDSMLNTAYIDAGIVSVTVHLTDGSAATIDMTR